MEQNVKLQSFFNDIYEKADKTVEKILVAYYIFGILLSFFYDTWIVGLGVGTILIVAYYLTKKMFKQGAILQFVVSGALAIFMAQFIYQMHGLFEMHFTAFISAIVIIMYQNWKVFIPLGLIVVLHHASFAYIQYIGVEQDIQSYKDIYFTQMEYMDFQTFLFHASLFAIALIISGLYSYQLSENSKNNAQNIYSLEEGKSRNALNIEFANSISNGDFDFKYDDVENDQLGTSLLAMRESLKESAEREKMERFQNIGLAKVSEIIQNNGDNINELAFEIISYLVKYLDANQGGLFILTEEDGENILELKASYAYERKKYLEKKVKLKEGLLGQCLHERETIYLTEIPDNYISISSGLGDACPSSLIIIPLKDHNNIEGVMELASFKEFKDFQIEFLEKLGENIASTLTSSRNNHNTRQLYENSKVQAEELKSQEEEMRQNHEELIATQEEMIRQKSELEGEVVSLREQLEALKSTKSQNPNKNSGVKKADKTRDTKTVKVSK